MNPDLLIRAIVQQTMVFVARLATAGGVRAPLSHLADRVFLDLTQELHNQGVTKKVIADMFGMALRTYHRRIRELTERSEGAVHTVWEAVLDFVCEKGPVSGSRIYARFRYDDREIVAGALADLVDTGLVYRAGRGDSAVYRLAEARDFAGDNDATGGRSLASMLWLLIYREGPLSIEDVAARLGLSVQQCQSAIDTLVSEGQVTARQDGQLESGRFIVAVGAEHGWEAAVLDHYQAMVNAIAAKLSGSGRKSDLSDTTGGATYSFELSEGHPHEQEVLALLGDLRKKLDELHVNVEAAAAGKPVERKVVFYLGQYVQE